MNQGTLLELRGISKSFGGVKALDRVGFELREGEIHGLVGENGAGKSTLMKILAGVHTRYEGEMFLRGQSVRFASPKSAKTHGIGMIYQELSSVGALSVAENLCLGDQPCTRFGIIDWKEMMRCGKAYIEALGVTLDLGAPVEDLPLGLQQIVEIARVVYSGASILIMDEPTSALSPPEVLRLFEIVRTLKRQGKSIIFISHFLDDVLEICDRVTVLRNGRKVAALDAAGLAKHIVIQHMLGVGARSLEEGYEGAVEMRSDESSPPVLEVRGAGRGTRLADIDFVVREGEILGCYGVMGSGHSLIGECLYGLKRFDRGVVKLGGKPLPRLRPTVAKRNGIAYVSPNRHASLFPDCEIFKNVTVAFLKQLLSFPLRVKKEIAIGDGMIDKLKVKAASSRTLLRNLSGGNQQKVALARWLVHPIRLLVLNEPTRGMDVGAKEEVMRIVKELKKQKVAILLISSEPETVLANSDRILVVSKGRLAAELSNRTVSKDELMRCA